MYNHQCARLVDAPFLHLIRWCLYHLSHNLPFYFNINRCSLVISTIYSYHHYPEYQAFLRG